MNLLSKATESFKRRFYGRTFRCPVCHLELAFADADNRGLVVCPLCGVVIEIAETYGHCVPVVHDVELYRPQPSARIHPLSAHFPVGLFPLVLMGAAAQLVLSALVQLAPEDSVLYEDLTTLMPTLSTVTLLLLVASLGLSAVAFVSGYRDWKLRYRKRPYRQIRVKIALSSLFLVLGTVAAVLHATGAVFSLETGLVDVTSTVGLAMHLAYMALLATNMTLLAALGHIGGGLVFGK